MPQLALVKERSSSDYIHHDQLFKDLIHTFFEEFLDAFFPEVHDMIDFHAVKPLSEEFFTDLMEGDTRRLDIVVETTLKETEAVIIIHVEPQSTKQTNFHERMYQYFSLLYHKYRKPIIPIAVFSYNENWEKKQYTMTFPFLNVLTFNYLTLHLRKKNWREFIKSNNPAAAALISKMGYTDDEKVQVKKEFLRMLVEMELNPAKQRLVYGFFEKYLILNETEEIQLNDEIKRMDEADKIMEIPISYEEKGKEKGKEIGKAEEKKEVAFKMLNKGSSIDFIAEVTGLDHEEIEALKER
ncbi:transposase [Lentibacillus sp. CBA3610]|uniref:transposase n=1 Tax=Lentibacillus sp. CBA3610 TaxID=2518176 RepID=UPI0015959F04|nr:transposase [Lentibacillus sp. CBA3610]QKY68733.1 transposase [Lentibacillus sp. CBA3610]